MATSEQDLSSSTKSVKDGLVKKSLALAKRGLPPKFTMAFSPNNILSTGIFLNCDRQQVLEGHHRKLRLIW